MAPGGEGGSNHRLVGVALVFAGALALAAYPYSWTLYRAPGGQTLVPFPAWLTCYGAVAFVWGACVVATDRWHSLTPVRAFAAPVVATVPFGVAAFVYRPSDTAVNQWAPPAAPLELADRTLLSGEGFLIAATLLLVVGVAAYRRTPRPALLAVAFVLAHGVAHGAVHATAVRGLLFRPPMALVAGILPALVGYHAAKPAPSADERPPRDHE